MLQVCGIRLSGIAIAFAVGIAAAVLGAQAPPQESVARSLVARLNLDEYKATIKGLTQFGDRRQGTERNRKAVDWIEARLRTYGCSTERLNYEYKTPLPTGRGTKPPGSPVIRSGEVRPG